MQKRLIDNCRESKITSVIRKRDLTLGVLALDDAFDDDNELEVESSLATASAICEKNVTGRYTRTLLDQPRLTNLINIQRQSKKRHTSHIITAFSFVYVEI